MGECTHGSRNYRTINLPRERVSFNETIGDLATAGNSFCFFMMVYDTSRLHYAESERESCQDDSVIWIYRVCLFYNLRVFLFSSHANN